MEGFCPGGFCRGLYIRGVYVQQPSQKEAIETETLHSLSEQITGGQQLTPFVVTLFQKFLFMSTYLSWSVSVRRAVLIGGREQQCGTVKIKLIG